MKVQDIEAGTRTPWYTAVEDARVMPGGTTVQLKVQYTDMGYGVREFTYDQEIETV